MRPSKKKPATKRCRIFAAVEDDVKDRLDKTAASCKVDLPTMMRWWVGEAVTGAWVPAHLRKR